MREGGQIENALSSGGFSIRGRQYSECDIEKKIHGGEDEAKIVRR